MSEDTQYELAKMKIGDRISSGEMEILKVPNGWIFYRFYYNEVSGEPEMMDGTFVPDLHGGAPKPKKKGQIVQLT